MEQRRAPLIQKTGERASDVPPGGAVQRRKKVVGVRTLPGMSRQEQLDALLKDAGPQVIFKHSDHCRAFRIRDPIECIRDVAGSLNGLADLPCGHQPVGIHGIVAAGNSVQVHLPIGSKLHQHLCRKPARKSLIQPNVIPPAGSYQIAKPLVSYFMRHGAGAASLPHIGVIPRPGQQRIAAIGDQARVFHRTPTGGQGNRQLVQFFVGKRNPEVILQQSQNLRGRGGGIRGLTRASAWHYDAQRYPVSPRLAGVHYIERSNRQRHQIGRKRLALRKSHRFESAGFGFFRDHRRIGKRAQFFGNMQCESPRRLERGFIEAGKRAPRCDRFKLAEQIPIAVVALLE